MAILHVKKCSNIGTSAIGLIGAKTPYGLFLKTRFGIHTFGVKFPIDVVILDSKQYAVRIKESLPPNHIFFWPPKWQNVLELPAGTIASYHIRIGQRVDYMLS